MKKFTQHKHFVTFVCLFVGAILLCSAAVANIGNAGGYKAYKDGLIGLLTMDNFSGEAKMTVYFDDQELASIRYVEQLNKDAKPGEIISYSAGSTDDEDFDGTWYMVNPKDHVSGNLYTRYNSYSSHSGSGKEWTLNSTDWVGGIVGDIDFDPNDAYTSRMLRLLEAAADLLVGDLKNNFVYLGGSNGESTYRISLSGSQLPEIVNAAMPLVFGDYFTIGYDSAYSVIMAVDFEYGSDDNWWEKYDAVRDEAWDHAMEDGGCYVIYSDLTYERFDNEAAYYSTIEPTMEVFLDSPRIFLAMMDGEPTIDLCTCELTVDKDGHLINNILEGTLKLKLVNGERHSITLRIEGNVTDIGTTKIALPVIDPMDTVTDRSKATHENGWEYTVTHNGITTTHTQAEEDQLWERERFFSMDPIDRISDASYYFLGDSFDVNYLDSPDPEIQYCYLISEDWYCAVDKDEFENAAVAIFTLRDPMEKFADNMGISPNIVTAQLLMDYEQITGRQYEGETAWEPDYDTAAYYDPEAGNFSHDVGNKYGATITIDTEPMIWPQTTSEPLPEPDPFAGSTTAPGIDGDC